MIQRYNIINKRGELIHSEDIEVSKNDNGYWKKTDDVIKAFEPVRFDEITKLIEKFQPGKPMKSELAFLLAMLADSNFMIVKDPNIQQPKRPGNLSGTEIPNP